MKNLRRACIGLLCAVLLTAGLFGCTNRTQDDGIQYVIGVSQANMRESWRLVLTREIREEAAKHPEIRVIFTDAIQDSDKQIKDIQRLLGYGVDLLIVSPCDSQLLTPVVSQVYQSIPVIVMDRAVEGFEYSLFIGPDNYQIGRQVGEAVSELFGSAGGEILEVGVGANLQATTERSKGFGALISQHSGLNVRKLVVEDGSRDSTEDLLLSYGDSLAEVDVIFAHNDSMALGAYRATRKLGYHPAIAGIDGFSGPDGGLDMVRRGMIAQTVTAPTGGREAIEYSLDILNQVSGVPKQIILRSRNINADNLDTYEYLMGKQPVPYDRTIRVGYSQLGAESTWRLANTKSIQEAAKEFGIELLYDEADQSQERQIAAIRRFIRERADVIVLSPVVESGWDPVLLEAKNAGIPVLLSDRKIDTSLKENLYLTYLGVDAVEEGRRAMRWLLTQDFGRSVRIMELQGTIGATPTLERGAGFQEILAQDPQFQIAHAQSGDYTIQGGKEVVESYLAQHSWDIDVIFAHNDDMALGAIAALEANGIRPGVDVKIISVDGAKPALEALKDGKINCVVECSPLLGPQLMKAITDLKSGKELPIRIITEEKVFTAENVEKEIRNRKY